MSDISEQEPSKVIGELTEALSSVVGKTEMVSKHCSKIGTTSTAEKEERGVNKSPSCEIKVLEYLQETKTLKMTFFSWSEFCYWTKVKTKYVF